MNDIIIKRYDLLDFTVDVTKADGSTYSLATGESLWFRVKGDADTTLMTAESTDKHFSFNEVTLPCGVYRMEVGINLEGGKEQTLIQGKLVVEERLREQ